MTERATCEPPPGGRAMRAEDVNPEWVEAVAHAWPESMLVRRHLVAALAAAAPLIAAQERERVAKWHDRQTEEATARAEDAKTRGETGNVLHHARFADAHRISAAAIRALGDADD